MRPASSAFSRSSSEGDAASPSTTTSTSSLTLSPARTAGRRGSYGAGYRKEGASSRSIGAQGSMEDPLQVQMRDLHDRLHSLGKQLSGAYADAGSRGAPGPTRGKQQLPSVAAAAAAAALSLGVDAAVSTGRAPSSHLLWASSLHPGQLPAASSFLTHQGTTSARTQWQQSQQQQRSSISNLAAGAGRMIERHLSPTRARPGPSLGAGLQEQSYGSQRLGSLGMATLHSTYVAQGTPRAQQQRQHSPGRGLGGRSWALGSLGLALTGAGTGSPSGLQGLGVRPQAVGRSGQWDQGAHRAAWESTSGPQGQGLAQLEEERLRSWVQELRHERRRLEDKLLMGDSQGMQALDQRDELEKQVLGLSRQRDALQAELSSMSSMQQTVQELSAEVESLRHALDAEAEAGAQHQAARSQLEAVHVEATKKMEILGRQHAQAVEELGRDRRILAAKYKKAAQRAVLAEEAGEKAQLELQQLRGELLTAERERAESRAASDVLRRANVQMQEQMLRSSHDVDSRVSELHGLLEDERRECRSSKQQLQDVRQDAAAAELKAREMSSRAEFLRSEREKVAVALQAEQQQSAAQKLRIEALQAQVRGLERQKEDVAQNACAQLEALQREYEVAVDRF